MADNRIIISEMVIKNSPVNTTEVDKVEQHFQKMGKAASDGSKIMETATNQSSARIKANFDRIVASLNPLDAALHRIEQAYQRDLRGIELARRKDQASQEQYTAALARLTDKRIADINREKQARLQAVAANQNAQQAGMPGRSGTQSSLNALFQMQDISMMAYAGQAPMMTAMQQGTQLAGILEQVRSAGGSVGTTLMAAFTGLFNPISFLAITLVGLSTAAIQFGMEWLAVTDDSAEAIKKQNDLIAQTADQWGAAMPALRAYNDELERNKNLAELAEARQTILDRQTETMGKALTSGALRPISTYLNRRLEEARIPGSAPPNLAEEQRLQDLLDTVEALRAKIDDGVRPTFQEMQALSKQLADTLGNSTDPAVKKLDEDLGGMNATMSEAQKIALGLSEGLTTLISPEATGNLEDFIRRTAAAVEFAARAKAGADAALRAQYARDINIAGSEESRRATLKFLEDAEIRYRRLQFELQGQTEIPVEDVTVPVPDVQTELDLNQMRQDAIEKRADAADKAAKKEADALEKLRGENERLFEAEQKRLEAARDFVSAQEDKAEAAELELATMGMEEDARTRLIDQMRIEQELRQTNVVLTQEQADAIREYAARSTEAKIQMDVNKEALSDLNEQQKFATDLGMDLFDAWIEGGKELTDVLKDIANALADAVLQAVLFGQGPLAGFFGTKPAAGFDIGGIVGTILGNKPGAGPTAGATAAQTWAAGSGWAGARTPGPVGGVDLMTTGATTAATTAATMGTSMFASAGKTRGGIDLVRIPVGNSFVNVDARYADRFAGLFSDLAAKGYPISSLGEHGYSYRNVAGTSNLSQHALGQAVDINPHINKYAYGATGDYARYGVNMSEMARARGLEYGGDWRKPDTMHVQVPRGEAAASAARVRADQMVARSSQQVVQANTALGQSSQQTAGGVSQLGQSLAQLGGGGGGGGGSWLSSLMGMFGGGQGFGGGGFHAGSFIGGGGFTSSLATGWATRIAMGAAFSGGNIIPFARGGIVDGPHLFPMARGAGLMGEAGPEAVMPLTRGANGKLGVAMSGGNTGVVIHNYSTAEVKPRENQEGTGWEFVIEDRTADRINTFGTPLNKSVRNATGSRLKRR